MKIIGTCSIPLIHFSNVTIILPVIIFFRDSNAANWEVIIGSHDLNAREASRIVQQVAYIKCNPNFDVKTFDYDVALVRLTQPVHRSTAINTVCLPQQGQDVSPGTICTATGWGNPGMSVLKGSSIRIFFYVYMTIH